MDVGLKSCTEAAPQTAHLLERVRRCALPQGEIPSRGTWLRQQGEMRFAPDRPWLPFLAEEWFEDSGIDFHWRAWVRMRPLVRARVVDSFLSGRGALTAWAFGIVPVLRSRGTAMDHGEALRGLAELPWHPSAFRDTPSLRWDAPAQETLRATFDDHQTRVTAQFRIDSAGQVLGCSALRPRVVGKALVHTPWSGMFREYRTFSGLRVPTLAEASWHLPEGPFVYWRGRVTDFRNCQLPPARR